MSMVRNLMLAAAMLAAVSTTTWAQSPDEGWHVNVYPILVWVPLGIDIDVKLPPDGGSDESASIVDGRFDGAWLAGASATNGRWRVDGDFIWAAVGGDRPERPHLTVDADLIYGRASVGHAVAKNFFVTGGVRRLALKYVVQLGDRPEFERKPGIWDPLVGVAFQHVGRFFEVNASFDGGGFGVGTDVDLGGTFRIDLKPIRYFGITAGYTLLYLKFDDDASNGRFTVEQTLHGPVAGIGFYF